jgi:hypothetical protein
MAEPYLPTLKDFDFLFKFLFSYFFIQIWAILTFQDIPQEKNTTRSKYEATINRLEAKPENELSFFEKIELRSAKTAIERIDAAPKDEEKEQLSIQRRQLFKFIFLSISLFVFAFTMIAFLDVPSRDIMNISIFIFGAATLLKYLFDYKITDGQNRMIVLAGISLYVDSLGDMAGRVSAQF